MNNDELACVVGGPAAVVGSQRSRIEALEAALKKVRGALCLVKEAASATVTDIKRGSFSTARECADAIGWNARDGIAEIDAVMRR